MTKTMICIVCPKGCRMRVCDDNGITVEGNGCKRGKEYAVKELTSPVRSVTGIVRIKNRNDKMVSVKTDRPIPKDKIFSVIEKIQSISVDAPVRIGDIIISDAYGASIVATKNVD